MLANECSMLVRNDQFIEFRQRRIVQDIRQKQRQVNIIVRCMEGIDTSSEAWDVPIGCQFLNVLILRRQRGMFENEVENYRLVVCPRDGESKPTTASKNNASMVARLRHANLFIVGPLS